MIKSIAKLFLKTVKLLLLVTVAEMFVYAMVEIAKL